MRDLRFEHTGWTPGDLWNLGGWWTRCGLWTNEARKFGAPLFGFRRANPKPDLPVTGSSHVAYSESGALMESDRPLANPAPVYTG
jgi:hypothetical protein